MKILITGHKGFIGKNFWRILDNKKNTLYGLDTKEHKDCRDFFKTSSQTFDLVIHLAAVIGGREAIDANPLALADNLSIDANLFTWALKAKPKKIVYFSSSAIYPISLQIGKRRKLKESDVLIGSEKSIGIPDKIYGWSKLSGELLAHQYSTHYGGKVYVFRPFSGYGIEQDLHYPFPAFINRAKKKENPFTIWGNGKQVRDFIHVDDIVQATLKALQHDIRGPINLGTGIPTSFNKLAQMITKQAGYKPRFYHMTKKPTGVLYRVAETTSLKYFYTPKISLEEGIQRSLK